MQCNCAKKAAGEKGDLATLTRLVDLESPCPCLETTDGVSAGPPAAPSPLHPRLVKRLSLQLQGPPLATARHPLRKPSKPYQADDDMPHLDSASQDKLASLQQARRACLVPSKPQPRPPASRGAPPVRRVLRHGAP